MMMKAYGLLTVFLILLIPASGMLIYPFRKSRKALLLIPVFILITGLAYWHWGAWSPWKQHLQALEQQQRARDLLKTIHGPAELIASLKATLRQQPDSARGWYLLGRLYASQHQWQQAGKAFARAYRLQPEDDQIAVNYAQNLWQLNHQRFNQTSRAVLKKVTSLHPHQPDALSLLAMDAWQHKKYKQAIVFWEHLLTLVSPQSDEAFAIRKAIAKARMKL